MLIIPAIDIMDGKVVRLAQGKKEDMVIYSDDPVSVAKRWQNEGAEWLHLVDLDGALNGNYKNWGQIKDIIDNVHSFIELGGGIRTSEAVEEGIRLGVKRIILGTKAAQDEGFVRKQVSLYRERIAVAIDYKNGSISAKGWTYSTKLDFIEFAKRIERLAVSTIICTDISRDGMLTGPNTTSIRQILKAVKTPAIASGGVSSIEDILKLKRLEPYGLCGVIVGKALYESRFSLREAISLSYAG